MLCVPQWRKKPDKRSLHGGKELLLRNIICVNDHKGILTAIQSVKIRLKIKKIEVYRKYFSSYQTSQKCAPPNADSDQAASKRSESLIFDKLKLSVISLSWRIWGVPHATTCALLASR